MSKYIPMYGTAYQHLKSLKYFLETRKWVKFDKFAIGSYAPVLVAVLRIRKFTSIQEIGSGFLSSRLFREYSEEKRMKHFIYESNTEWFEKIFKITKGASNTTLHLVGKLSNNESDKLLTRLGYDASLTNAEQLVFVDDGQIAEDRIRTINTVFEELKSITIIHDAQTSAYRMALNRLQQKNIGLIHYFDERLPSTAVFVPKEIMGHNSNLFRDIKLEIDKLPEYSGSSEEEFFNFCRSQLFIS